MTASPVILVSDRSCRSLLPNVSRTRPFMWRHCGTPTRLLSSFLIHESRETSPFLVCCCCCCCWGNRNPASAETNTDRFDRTSTWMTLSLVLSNSRCMYCTCISSHRTLRIITKSVIDLMNFCPLSHVSASSCSEMNKEKYEHDCNSVASLHSRRTHLMASTTCCCLTRRWEWVEAS